MKYSWRWFGPKDKVTLSDAKQAGASGIVTALYDTPPGQTWAKPDIAARKRLVEKAGLNWEVVESLPVSEVIKTNGKGADQHIKNWITSLENLAANGIKVVCYNFMPVLDWTRTDLTAPMPSGARALRFDLIEFAMFDQYILQRPAAKNDYTLDINRAAKDMAKTLTANQRADFTANILAGLPGAVEAWTLNSFREKLDTYKNIDAEFLRKNLVKFLQGVVPHAQRLGIRLCCHPDDPPWPLFGLPRIISTADDLEWLINVAPSPANGITFCTGSLGARADNDLPKMIQRFGPHIHFLHLRNVRRENSTVPCSFFEDEHLCGSTDMVAVIKAVVAEEKHRRAQGRNDHSIPMRPDHGQEILTDQSRGSAPGYPAIGRLKGLAELRGVAMALEHDMGAQHLDLKQC